MEGKKIMKNKSVKKIVFAAMVGALYAALTFALAPISYGDVQFRVSEVLCIQPFFMPSSVWGLFVGCALANVISAYGIMDIVFGSLATLLAGLCTMYLGKISRRNIAIKILACLPPVIFNGVIVGGVLAYAAAPGAAFWSAYLIIGVQVAMGELAVLMIPGLLLMCFLPKAKFFRRILSLYDPTLLDYIEPIKTTV